MERYKDRIYAGALRAGSATSLEGVQILLSRDVHIIAPSSRTTTEDLWPCVWALCACLERQFTGAIHISCGLNAPLSQPAALCDRCSFGTTPGPNALHIYIGTTSKISEPHALYGDALQESHQHHTPRRSRTCPSGRRFCTRKATLASPHF